MTKDFLDLEVPYGLHPEGYMVSVKDADSRIEYLCPDCEEPLILRAGEYKVRHFAHKANTNCSGESIIHKTAKMLIAQAVSQHADTTEKRTIELKCICKCCKLDFLKKLSHGTFTSAYEEKAVDNYICDVVAQKDGKDVLAIEILFTHKVDEIKAKNISLHWIELSAENVLSNPYVWEPTQAKLKDVVCEDCKKHIKKLEKILNKWGGGIYPAAIYKDISKGQYLAEIETCYRCKEEIPVFWWSGVPFCEIEPPKKDRPKTVKLIYSKSYGGQYWANTCPKCSATQGDNFLFIGLKGVRPIFKGLPLRQTPEMVKAQTEAFASVINHMFRHL